MTCHNANTNDDASNIRIYLLHILCFIDISMYLFSSVRNNEIICTVPSWFSRCHRDFKILQLEFRVGGGSS